MKKFQFSLSSLLAVKVSMEKQLKAEIAEAEGRLRTFENQKQAVEDRLAQAKTAHLQKLRAGSDAGELARDRIGFDALFEKIAACEEKIRVAKEERDRVRAALVTVMADRKMLERLREKQWEEYREELKKEEAANIDDFLSSRLARERREKR